MLRVAWMWLVILYHTIIIGLISISRALLLWLMYPHLNRRQRREIAVWYDQYIVIRHQFRYPAESPEEERRSIAREKGEIRETEN
jgi:hypothetical protein